MKNLPKFVCTDQYLQSCPSVMTKLDEECFANVIGGSLSVWEAEEALGGCMDVDSGYRD